MINGKPLVYLAGPITGYTYNEVVDWREAAVKALAPDVIGLSPMRSKSFLKAETSLAARGYAGHALASSRGIITRDRFDCCRCDLLLINLLGARIPSIGTIMEIAWGNAFGKPKIFVIEDGLKDHPHDHAMVNECVDYQVPTLEEAIFLAKAILLPVPH